MLSYDQLAPTFRLRHVRFGWLWASCLTILSRGALIMKCRNRMWESLPVFGGVVVGGPNCWLPAVSHSDIQCSVFPKGPQSGSGCPSAPTLCPQNSHGAGVCADGQREKLPTSWPQRAAGTQVSRRAVWSIGGRHSLADRAVHRPTEVGPHSSLQVFQGPTASRGPSHFSWSPATKPHYP